MPNATTMARILEALVVVGALLVVVKSTLRYLTSLGEKTAELSEIDTNIKASLREELSELRQRREHERNIAALREEALRAAHTETVDTLAAVAADRASATTMIGSALLAADFTLGFASWRIRKQQAAETAFIATGSENFTDALSQGLAALARSDDQAERLVLAGEWAGRLASEHGKVVGVGIGLSREARSLARLCASVVPLALEEGTRLGPGRSRDDLLNPVREKYFNDEGPLAPDGSVRRPVLGVPYNDPD